MSSTLLSSIFGAVEKDTENRLFDDKSNKSFPDRPQFEARVGKRNNADNETTTPKEQDATIETPKKKKHKQRNPKTKNEEKVTKESSATTDKETTTTTEKDTDESSSSSPRQTTEDDAQEINNINKNDRTVFVGNLPLETTRKSLAFLFRECGKVESTRLRSVAAAGVKLPPERAGDQNLMRKVCANTAKLDSAAKSTAQGYVVFCSQKSVAEALKLNNTKQHNGVLLRVDTATPTMDASRSVFVGNLPYKADESSLQQYILEQCQFQPQQVEGVRIVRDKETMQCKGFAYILFAEKSLARQALDVLSKSSQPYLKRNLRFQVCGRRFKSTTTSTKRSFEGKRAAAETGAAKRISTKKRARGNNTKKSAAPHKKSSKSKRAAAQAKEEKRVKQLQKRLSKGMGKARK